MLGWLAPSVSRWVAFRIWPDCTCRFALSACGKSAPSASGFIELYVSGRSWPHWSMLCHAGRTFFSVPSLRCGGCHFRLVLLCAAWMHGSTLSWVHWRELDEHASRLRAYEGAIDSWLKLRLLLPLVSVVHACAQCSNCRYFCRDAIFSPSLFRVQLAEPIVWSSGADVVDYSTHVVS